MIFAIAISCGLMQINGAVATETMLDCRVEPRIEAQEFYRPQVWDGITMASTRPSPVAGDQR